MASSFEKLDRVPPSIPIIWQDWESSPDTQGMTPAEEGLYFRFIRKQWVLDELPADPWKLAKLLGVTDYRTVERWLTKYSHLTVKTQRHNGKCTVKSQLVNGSSTVDSQPLYCGCPVTLLNLKLKNLKNDVISSLALGTTEPKPKPNQTEPEVLSFVKKLESGTDGEKLDVCCFHDREGCLSKDGNSCLDCGFVRGSKRKGATR